jgi:hypothetical protein
MYNAVNMNNGYDVAARTRIIWCYNPHPVVGVGSIAKR